MIDDLTAILSQYPAAARPLSPPEPLGNAGGLSGARLWRFRSGRGLLVARCWPPEWPPRAHLEQIHGWLGETEHLGFVPLPMPDLNGRSVHERSGRLWEVAPWMPGRAEPNQPPAPARLRAGFTGLAAFHQALARHRAIGPSPGLLRRLRDVESWQGGGFERLERIGALHRDDPCAALARRWIEAARPLAPAVAESLRAASSTMVPLQPCLRDLRADHLLFEGGTLTGLVDFGAMAVDTVAGDLARLLSEWVGPHRAARAQALDAYTALRALDEPETRLIAVFERSTDLLRAGLWAGWHFFEGRAFTDPGAVLRGLERGLASLADD